MESAALRLRIRGPDGQTSRWLPCDMTLVAFAEEAKLLLGCGDTDVEVLIGDPPKRIAPLDRRHLSAVAASGDTIVIRPLALGIKPPSFHVISKPAPSAPAQATRAAVAPSSPPPPSPPPPTPPDPFEQIFFNGDGLVARTESLIDKILIEGGGLDLDFDLEEDDWPPSSLPDELFIRRTPSSPWACAACTLVNTGSALVCDACGGARTGAAMSATSAAGSSRADASPSDPVEGSGRADASPSDPVEAWRVQRRAAKRPMRSSAALALPSVSDDRSILGNSILGGAELPNMDVQAALHLSTVENVMNGDGSAATLEIYARSTRDMNGDGSAAALEKMVSAHDGAALAAPAAHAAPAASRCQHGAVPISINRHVRVISQRSPAHHNARPVSPRLAAGRQQLPVPCGELPPEPVVVDAGVAPDGGAVGAIGSRAVGRSDARKAHRGVSRVYLGR
jgi:hypothetical protein